METTLDEDFVNFEAFSQTCASTTLTSGADEEIRLLDNEARQRERRVQGERLSEAGDSDSSSDRLSDTQDRLKAEMKPPSERMENGGESTAGALPSEYHLFTTFSYNSNSKKLTMMPVKYKIKEERRKVLKISVNKLKKIDDPESWLCRSVLINNTMKKLQKETRDEKINKQMNVMTLSKNFIPRSSENDEFGCQLNNNNNNNSNHNKNNNNNNNNDNENNKNASNNNKNNSNNVDEKVYRVSAEEGAECFYEKDLAGEGFYKVGDAKSEEFLFQVDKAIENEVKSVGKMSHSEEDSEDKLNSSISGGVSLNEDFVEKIPSIKRCASRKKSVDEDGTADEILNLNDGELVLNCENGTKGAELEDVDECDVHDVLSQLYMPPTPRMLTSIDSDTDDDELNVVDIDASYIDGIKSECQKLPNEGFFDGSLLGGESGGVKAEGRERGRVRGREREEGEGEGGDSPAKRRKVEDVFSCFNVCEESYDNFLCGNRNGENERTSEACKDSGKSSVAEEELIELEDEEDIKRRLSQSLSSHYHRKAEKTCDNFFEDNCDNQYSCGHTVTMFSDMQTVTFHNLIASLET